MTTTTITHTHRRVPALWVIARKEISDAFRNRLFLISMIMLLGLSLIAIGLGSLSVRTQMTDYLQSVQILTDLGRTDFPAAPPLNPIAVSKNFINYLAMVGALLAMILGFTSINKERQAGTLRLILSRPVYRDQFLTGKVLGNAALLAVLMTAVGLITFLAIGFIGRVWLTGDQIIRLALTMGMSWLYLMTFYLLAQFFTLLMPNTNHALLLTVIVWLVFAFIFPQIGDTMDLDNQLPGGFFATLGLDKAGEEQALQQFKWYETIRDGVEELSPTKHYERISYALLGIKKEFNENTWQEVMRLKLINLAGLTLPIVLLLSASYVVFLRQEA
ncbi:MAG: ABC transporter permease [Ardenticatenaceae bacterium]|nr:ABC transporter permease [Ardenticatenaceae bacterium]